MFTFALAFFASLSTSSAHADEISSGDVFPGASDAASGTGSVGGNVTAITSNGGLVGGVLGVDASWAPTDRLGLRVVAHGIAAPGDGEVVGVGAGVVGARYLVVDTAHFRLAPWAGVAVAGADNTEGAVIPGVGVSMEAGGKNVWFDASLPVVAVMPNAVDAGVTVVAPTFSVVMMELGVNGRIAEHHSLRLGLESLSVNARYRYEADAWYVGAEASAVAIPTMGGVGSAGGFTVEGGMRF